MSTLYEIRRTHGHVVTKIVETEFVVRAESNICLISLATRFRVGLVFVNAINTETMEHIYRSIPFRVTLSQVVVHSHDVNPIAGECIKENREGRYQCLTFTCGHLGNFTLMQNDTTEELNIVVDHVPGYLVTPSCPMVLVECLVALNGNKIVSSCQFAVEIVGGNLNSFIFRKASCRFLYNRKHLRHNFIERILIAFQHIFFKFVDLVEDQLTVLNWSLFNL